MIGTRATENYSTLSVGGHRRNITISSELSIVVSPRFSDIIEHVFALAVDLGPAPLTSEGVALAEARGFRRMVAQVEARELDAVARYLGPDALVVRGRYLAPTERGIALSVEAVESRGGDISRWAGETVVVPGDFVRRVEQRRVSRSKVVLLAGVAMAGFVVTYQAFGPPSSGGLSGAGGSGPSPR